MQIGATQLLASLNQTANIFASNTKTDSIPSADNQNQSNGEGQALTNPGDQVVISQEARNLLAGFGDQPGQAGQGNMQDTANRESGNQGEASQASAKASQPAGDDKSQQAGGADQEKSSVGDDVIRELYDQLEKAKEKLEKAQAKLDKANSKFSDPDADEAAKAAAQAELSAAQMEVSQAQAEVTKITQEIQNILNERDK